MLKDRQNDFLGTGGVPAWHVLAHATLVSDICKRQSDTLVKRKQLAQKTNQDLDRSIEKSKRHRQT